MIRSRRLRRGIFLAELLAVLMLVFGFLAVGRGYLNCEAYGHRGVGASTRLLLSGGPLFLLGARLHGAGDGFGRLVE
jgi:hypothetical protein